ncbi:MAG: DUF4384 domain-containing protein [Rhodoferax sp.]|nr:DUF4384 domain-containing protein [Rhodoferax sp.]
MQVENLAPDRTVFETGDQVFLSAAVSRNAHLYCYFAEAGGHLIRVLPNPTHPGSRVSANQALRIPDWMSPSPGFTLDAGTPGQESLMCLATEADAAASVPAALMGPGLRIIDGYKGVDSVQEAFVQALGEATVTVQTVRWKVQPRRNRSR